MNMKTFEWIQLAGVGVTLLAVLVALFKDEIWRILRKPNLDITLKNQSPDCHISGTTWKEEGTGRQLSVGNWYYLRLWVCNKGKSPATNVQVFASKLLKATAPNNFIKIGDFLPMNLQWAHTKEIFRGCIAPDMGRHCDLGHIADPKFKAVHKETKPTVSDDKTILCLELEVRPLTLIHLLQPGEYKLELIVAADNVKPKRKIVSIGLTGDWFETENEMFEKGVVLSID
jgi:hypothetical protein